MDNIIPHIDLLAIVLLAISFPLFYYLWRWSKGFIEPYIGFSNVRELVGGTGWAPWSNFPKWLYWTALASFSLAFIDPHFFVAKKGGSQTIQTPTEGIAIYLVLDQSGSMAEQVAVETDEGLVMLSKIDLLKKVSEQFIEGDPKLGLGGRPDDMIGLVFFARAAKVMAPLTLDHRTLLKELSRFNVIGIPDHDGTSIGYAIFKTANLIAATRHYAQELIGKGKPAYIIKNSVIILITDGLQDPNPLDKGKRLRNMDVPEAAQYAKDQGVKLYIINVEPGMSSEEFAPYRNIMQRAAELTGGKFFMVGMTGSLASIYASIDKLEKSAIPEVPGLDKAKRPDLYHRVSVYPYLIAFGMLCLLTAIVLESFIIRRVP